MGYEVGPGVGSVWTWVCIHWSLTEILTNILLVWPLVPLPQVFPHVLNWIFTSKTWFFGIYLNFHWQKSLSNQSLTHSESKSFQINSIKSCSSRSFQQHQKHIPIPPKFSATISFHFILELIQYSRPFASQVQTPWNHARAPLLIESFPKTPRTWSQTSQFSGSHNYKTKQTTFIDR